MKVSGNLLISFLLMVVIASLYRIMPRPLGFAPQIAMCIFGGAVIKDKKLAFLFPLLSMFLSDALYELLYVTGVGNTPGFYQGQLSNYILFGSMTIFGLMIRNVNFKNILIASIIAPTVYFILSNGWVWLMGGGLHRPKNFSGLMLCYNDGWPFYTGSLVATCFFSAVLFGGYYLVRRYTMGYKNQLA